MNLFSFFHYNSYIRIDPYHPPQMDPNPAPKRARTTTPLSLSSAAQSKDISIKANCANLGHVRTPMEKHSTKEDIVNAILRLLRGVKKGEGDTEWVHLSDVCKELYAPNPPLTMPLTCLGNSFLSFNCHAKAAIGWKGFPYIHTMPNYTKNALHNALGQLRMFSAGATLVSCRLLERASALASVLGLKLSVGAVRRQFKLAYPCKLYFKPGSAKTEMEALKEIVNICEFRVFPMLCCGRWDLALFEQHEARMYVKSEYAVVEYLKKESALMLVEKFSSMRALDLCHDIVCFALTLKRYAEETDAWLNYLLRWTRLPLAMALHERLGANAPISCIGEDLLCVILSFVE